MSLTIAGLLGRDTLHACLEEIKKSKGSAPWVEKLVVNEQMSGTLICQPAGHKTDTHYHLTDEWWIVVEGEIIWEIEGHAPVHAKAGDFVYAPARHYHHIKPTGTGPSIRLAITPAGEFHRHDRPEGEGPRA
jgi:mannose-6-phosphate isomerase-like protein (cupin superfamily)